MKSLITFSFSALMLLSTEGFTQKTSTNRPKIASKSVAPPTHATKKVVPTKSAKIKFLQDKMDFGTIKEDSIVEKKFEFTNTGNSDLVIISATGSCGCTIPTYPKIPIAPGDKGTILVKFTARNKFGPQKPTVTVTSNANPSIMKIQLEGWVEQIPGGVSEKG